MTHYELMQICVGPSGTRIIKDKTREVATFFESETGTMVIAFGPTMGNLLDWMKNFDLKTIKFGMMESVGGSVIPTTLSGHEGFIVEYVQCVEAIKVAVSYVLPQIKQFIFTGFSQGGAHAQLAYLHFAGLYSKIPSQCIVFGSPRVFDRIGVKILKEETKSVLFSGIELVCIHADPIPHYPMWLLGYRDGGRKKMLGKKVWFPWLSQNNHSPDAYLKATKEIV